MPRVLQILKSAHSPDFILYTATPDMTILDAVLLARDNHIGALPVLKDGKLVGIISERDFAYRVLVDNVDPATVTVGDYMTPDPQCVTKFTDLIDCMNLMQEIGVRHLPVLDDDGKLAGIVSLRDVLFVLFKDTELLNQQFEAYIRGE